MSDAPAAEVASMVALAGSSVSTGAAVSTTVTVPVAVAVRPALSVAVQLTRLAPSGSTEPVAGMQLTAGAF